MHKGQFIFTQVCKFLPKRAFDCLVNKYDGNKWVKSFTCWNHLLVLIYGQLSNRESLRDLVTSLAPFRNMFHHLGFGANVTRSNLSKANEQRDPRIFEEYALKLISIAREKRTGLKDFFISNNVYAFDSTTISLCLSVFWWTKLHHGKSGVKVHTLFDVKNSIPSFAIITGAEIHDSQVMDQIPYEVDSFYIFDRAYMDTKQLYAIDKVGAFFVVREKQTKPLRRIVFYDKEKNRTFVFYTNNIEVSAEDVALLYKYRWSVELFFKWMKQHLRIKEFYGTTENAVKIQVYAAITTYCLVSIIETEMAEEMTTYEVLRVLSTSLLIKMPLRQLLSSCQEELLLENKREIINTNKYIQLEIPFDEW